MLPFLFQCLIKDLPETKTIQSYKLNNTTRRFIPRYQHTVDLDIRDEYYDIDSDEIRHGPTETR
jgi:hypothetical protein